MEDAVQVLAMISPKSLGGKTISALLLLLLVGLLVRLVRGRPLTKSSVLIAIVCAVTVVTVLCLSIPGVLGERFLKLKVYAAVVGGLGGAFFFRSVRLDDSQRRTFPTLRSSVLTFICGPLVGLIVAGLKLLLIDVHPLDRVYFVVVHTLIGTVAGLIGAVVVAFASSSGQSRSSPSDK